MANHGFAYGGQTILSHPIFIETILPFLLVFTIVFAVLQKSKIFGEGKKQIDSIVSLVIGLVLISFAQATGIIIQLIPFLAVSLVVILVFMLLLGSFTKEGELAKELHPGIKWVLIIGSLIAVIIAVLFITGTWDYIYDFIFLTGIEGSSIVLNAVFFVVIIAAVIFVIWGAKKKDS
jgi:hypothetical protein